MEFGYGVAVTNDARARTCMKYLSQTVKHWQQLKLFILFKIFDILVNTTYLAWNVDALRAVRVTLLATNAIGRLTLLLYSTVIPYQECTTSLAVVLVL
jgi:hypothetical protein